MLTQKNQHMGVEKVRTRRREEKSKEKGQRKKKKEAKVRRTLATRRLEPNFKEIEVQI